MAIGVATAILSLNLFDAIAWHRRLMTGTAALTLVFVSTTAVLLALPSSSAYFRAAKKARAGRRAANRPAHQPVGYYGAPGYPPAPYPQPVQPGLPPMAGGYPTQPVLPQPRYTQPQATPAPTDATHPEAGPPKSTADGG
jgi:hypothetical protein